MTLDRIGRDRALNDLRPIAVSAGFLLDVMGTWLTSLAIIAMTPGLAALSEEQQTTFLATNAGAQAVGALWTIAGGFLAAHLATDGEIANAFAVGALSTILGFLGAFSSPPDVPFAFEAVGLAITIPLALAGGWSRAAFRRGPPRP